MESSSHKRIETLPPSIESLYSKGGLVDFLRQNNLRLSKAMGQNFLLNRKTMQAILDAMDWPREGWVIEIGPGLGHLTWLLLQRGNDVAAIEKDRTLIPLLQELACDLPLDAPRLAVLEDDACEVDFFELATGYRAQCVIGNLPYYAVAPIVLRLAYSRAPFRMLGFMVQREVGDRILAKPKTKDYGRLSIVMQYFFHVTKVKIVPPGAFFPAPNVESMFLKFVPKTDVDHDLAQNYLERVVQLGFSHRRKKLRGQFKGCIVQWRVFDDDLLKRLETEFDLDQRAEEWSVETWVRFAETIRATAPQGESR